MVLLRLVVNTQDHLAWRTLFRVRPGIGPKAIEKLYHRAKSDSSTFSKVALAKAKGLTADATIVMAVEDELLPGRADGEHEGDERRLLYVSLSRARRYLNVTHERLGASVAGERVSGSPARSPGCFLRARCLGKLRV